MSTESPNPSSNQPKDPSKNEPEKTKDNIAAYFRSNLKETISYVLLILGILLIYFEPLYGGLLVGIVTGIYFGSEIQYLIEHGREILDKQGIPRCLVMAGLAFSFLISAPAIFIGIALAFLIQQLFNPPKRGS